MYDLAVSFVGQDEPTISKAEYLEVKDLPDLEYYEPNSATFKIYHLSDTLINTLSENSNHYSFDKLKNSEKIIEQDILRMTHLTDEQKQELIEIHKSKVFKDFES